MTMTVDNSTLQIPLVDAEGNVTTTGTQNAQGTGIGTLGAQDFGANRLGPGAFNSHLPTDDATRAMVLGPQGKVIAGMLFTAQAPAIEAKWSGYIGELGAQGGPIDVNALVQAVLREAYLANTEDLRFYAEKVKFYNELKKEIRAELDRARTAYSSTAGEGPEAPMSYEGVTLDPTFYSASAPKLGTVGELDAYKAQLENRMASGGLDAAAQQAYKQELTRVRSELEAHAGLEADAPLKTQFESSFARSAFSKGEMVTSREGMENYIQIMEEKLNSVGDDAQLANVDLQNMLQKQQQTLQMMSNISKMLHDTAMAILRKIGG